ncbi:MAG: protein kinase, partial [Candidatus Obscuribacterales bacterium]|nr:protein kinase [Candidatus Obscuribacterales bacterium]
DPSMWKRFEQEAKSASLLNHPNIITVHDFGVTEDGDLYLVMEYLEGASLNDFIEMNGQLNERTCAKIFTQVCDALTHAHGVGILHRDLKPTNIFISSTSRGPHVKVLDFGLAKVMMTRSNPKEKITKTGECLGTPDYMSPEQSRGLNIDQRSDIYATGVCMFEALTGKLPFSAEDLMQILSRQISEQPPSFKDVAPKEEINKEIEAIVLKCMEKDPQKRFQSMAELNKALSGFLQKQKEEQRTTPGSKKANDKKVDKDNSQPPNNAQAKTPADKPVKEKTPKERVAQDILTDVPSQNSPTPKSEQAKAAPRPALPAMADSASKISRITGRSAKMALWGFTAASIILFGTAAKVLMPSKKEPPPVHSVNGILYFYNRTGNNALAELNVEGKTMHVAVFSNDAVRISQPEGLLNGAVWKYSYHQGANGPELDAAEFSGVVDPTVREADAVVRRHYGQLGRKQWEAAYDNIDTSSTLRKSSFDEFKKGFKTAKHNPDSELAPGNATKVVSIKSDSAKVLVDISYFSKGGSGYYAFQLTRKKGRWLISAVKLISQSEWDRT